MADLRETYGAIDQIAAAQLMRQRGAFEPGVGERMAQRRGTERWHPGRGEAPGTNLPHPGGKVREPGSLIPGEHHKMAADSVKSFAKLVGVKKKHVRQMMRGI
jgi:hypothetical protein